MFDSLQMDVYFHRLAPGRPTEKSLYELYQDGYVVCHYDDTASFDEADYGDGAADLEAMVDAAEEGGICLVQLDAGNDHYDRGRMLGVIAPGTEPVVVGVTEGGERTEEYTDPDAAAEALEGNEDVSRIYKAVEMAETRELEAYEYQLSAYEIPYTTFSPWGVVEDQIRSFAGRESLPIDEPTSYSPDQTERLCEEYLREENGYFLLIQPGGKGGTNQDFDLIGGIRDQRVFGEVKNIKGVSEAALDDLEAEIGPETRAFYFSRNRVDASPDGVEVVLLEEVLGTLEDIDRTRRMIKKMTDW